jgi:hypothetical protein
MIYTVYHKALDGGTIWTPFTPEEVRRHFTPYAVSKHPKYLVNAPAPVIEAELPWHNPLLQERGYLETTCYVHVLRNNLHLPHELVGVTQYDMRWTPEAAAMLRDAEPGDAFAMFDGRICEGGFLHPLALPDRCDWSRMLRSFNERFKTGYSLFDLDGQPFTLCQTYILPREVFAELAGWLDILCEELYPWANQPPWPEHWGHLAGCTERASAMFVAFRNREGRIRLRNLPLIHDLNLAAQLNVARQHYGETMSAPPAGAGA